MKFLPFAFFFLLALPFEAGAVPGPLLSWGIGLISAAWAFFAMAVGAAALATVQSWGYVKNALRTQRKFVFATFAALLAIVFSVAYYAYSFQPSDSTARLRQAIKTIPPSAIRSGDYSKMESVLTFADSARTGKDAWYPELEKEIAYSIGRNRNVVWSRYLSDGKIRIDETLLAEIRRWAYSMPLPDLLDDLASKKDSYRIVDLRTVEEFETSAHFSNASNLEYRKIMNGEESFDVSKTYVFVCHDGTYDLSRSLVAAIYLRQKGIAAFALDTGMKPLLDAFSIAPISFGNKSEYSVWSKGRPAGSKTVVDPLGALSTLPGVAEAGFKIRSFPFYKMATPEYSAGYSEIEKAALSEGVTFACYDTFSCFYSRIFAERLSLKSPKAGMSITVFR